MKIIEMPREELLVIEPRIFEDDRGFFYETHHWQSYRKYGIATKPWLNSLETPIRGLTILNFKDK